MISRSDTQWRHNWSASGVQVALTKGGATLPLAEWESARPSAARVAGGLGMAPEGSALHFTHAELAGLSDYDARQFGLPLRMEAIVHLHAEARIDSGHFRLGITVEPLQTAQPWVNYRRDGARILVGERSYRLNPTQLEAMELAERIQAAKDVAQRLNLFPALLKCLRAPREARLIASGAFAHVTVAPLGSALATRTLYTRQDGRLLPVSAAPGANWAMGPHRHYYLRNA
ncbi:MAG: hypothetical protein WDN72_07765 [Alphaproteobacteria bacterium]